MSNEKNVVVESKEEVKAKPAEKPEVKAKKEFVKIRLAILKEASHIGNGTVNNLEHQDSKFPNRNAENKNAGYDLAFCAADQVLLVICEGRNASGETVLKKYLIPTSNIKSMEVL